MVKTTDFVSRKHKARFIDNERKPPRRKSPRYGFDFLVWGADSQDLAEQDRQDRINRLRAERVAAKAAKTKKMRDRIEANRLKILEKVNQAFEDVDIEESW